jgi:uncharacterized membrane protein
MIKHLKSAVIYGIGAPIVVSILVYIVYICRDYYQKDIGEILAEATDHLFLDPVDSYLIGVFPALAVLGAFSGAIASIIESVFRKKRP